MKKSVLTAALTLVLAAALLAGITALVYASVPDYPDTLGADPGVTEKITGETLVAAAAAEPDSLVIFGSSELKTTDICTHPANFFAGKRCGFQVDLVGRGSCQSLVHALSIAGSGEALRGKKIVLITAPQSYVEGGIAPDLFMANFSGQQALHMLADDPGRNQAVSVRARTAAYGRICPGIRRGSGSIHGGRPFDTGCSRGQPHKGSASCAVRSCFAVAARHQRCFYIVCHHA